MASTSLPNRRGKPMQTASPTAITNLHAPAAPRVAFGDWIATRKWDLVFLLFIAAIQVLYLAGILWGGAVPESSGGIVALIKRDLGQGVPFISLFFIFSIFMSLRNRKPSIRYGLVLLGQGVFVLFHLIYLLRKEATILGMGVHGGLFAICLAAILSIARAKMQEGTSPSFLRYAQHFLMPTVSVSLVVIAIGLVFSEGGAAGEFIEVAYGGENARNFLAFLMVAGAGLVCLNHIHPIIFWIAMIPQFLYTVIILSLLQINPTISLTGVIGNIAFSITLVLIALIQMQQFYQAPAENKG